MRPGGGKQKGGVFERWVSKRISIYLTKGKRDDVLWRSSTSGGRATVQARKGKTAKAQAGDLSAIAAEGYHFADTFFIECKSYRNLDYLHFLLGTDKGKLNGFWDRAVVEARGHGKWPILITKQNLTPPLVISFTHRPRYLAAGTRPPFLASPLLTRLTPDGAIGVWWFESVFTFYPTSKRKQK